MVFRFYINSTLVDEPVGFDATKIKLKRSDNYHGIMAESDNQTVEIYGNGYTILKALYDADGIDAVATMLIQYKCGDEFVDLGEYSITFYNSEWYCGEDCYCKIGLERKGCLYKLTNAIDTKVDMDAAMCIDGVTSMADYEWMGKEIDVPSKSILLTDSAKSEEEITQSFNDILGGIDEHGWNEDPSLTGTFRGLWTIPFGEIGFDEFGEFVPLPTLDLWSGGTDLDINTDLLNKDNAIYLNVDRNDIKCLTTEIEIRLKLKARLTIDTTASYSVIFSGGNPSMSINIMKSDEVYGPGTIISSNYATLVSTVGTVATWEWDIDTTVNTTLTSVDTKIYLYGFYAYLRTTTGVMNLDFTTDADSLFTLTTLSICDSTPAKVYLVNEALSHTAEYVTNNCLRVYSEFLGRTDSQPYNMFADGCGGMLALTYGLFLRQIEKVKETNAKPVFSLSFQDIINAIDAIYGIGFTIEQRSDVDVLRVENWEYFYNDTVITDIGSVTVKKKPDLNLHIKNFKTGYSRYEAEEYNGLDEFLTEREYSTKLVNHNKTLEKECKFIASGYAIEITRRKGNDNTKDWRFDNDTFILCVERGGSYGYTGEGIIVEQANITNDANILDAPTVLNFRISPARMAMRWFKYLTTFIKDVKELVFTSGKGNIAAEGELESGCKIDSGVISEKQNLLETDFLYSQIPLFSAELHEVNDVPFTHEQYKLVKANPEGLIAYSCDGVQSYGWIKEIEYSFVDGSADFILIPKY